jgi:hypothetical protein
VSCTTQARGAVELYFYGELSAAERADVHAHLRHCAECRRALDDLSLIRAALASRPEVASPPGGEWSGFMARLDEALRREHADSSAGEERPAPPAAERSAVFRLAPYLAAAAVLALVTAAVAMLTLRRPDERPVPVSAGTPPASIDARRDADPALVSVSGQHFERSKLVVLGLTTRDASAGPGSSWEYERDLATALLGDTKLYRQVAEERGMSRLAGVMRDLELVLLQISMADDSDSESLEQLQRLIRRRDLITRMDAVHAVGP